MTSLPAIPAGDGFSETAQESGNQALRGPKIKYTKGVYTKGLPPPRKVPRRAPTVAERHAAAEMGRAMSAAHGGGEYPDLQPGVGFSRFDHPGWS